MEWIKVRKYCVQSLSLKYTKSFLLEFIDNLGHDIEGVFLFEAREETNCSAISFYIYHFLSLSTQLMLVQCSQGEISCTVAATKNTI